MRDARNSFIRRAAAIRGEAQQWAQLETADSFVAVLTMTEIGLRTIADLVDDVTCELPPGDRYSATSLAQELRTAALRLRAWQRILENTEPIN